MELRSPPECSLRGSTRTEARQGAVRAIDLDVEAIPRRVDVELESARLVSGDIVHAGDTVMVEATLAPGSSRRAMCASRSSCLLGWARAICGCLSQIPVRWTGRWTSRARPATPADMDTALAQARSQHPADRIYVSLLVPETQAGVDGQTLSSLPLSVANALEPLRAAQDVSLNGESAELEADAPAGGLLSGFQLLNLRIEPGGGLN